MTVARFQRLPLADLDRLPSDVLLTRGGRHTVQQIAAMFGGPRSTIYGYLDKARTRLRPAPAAGRAAS